MAQVKKTIVRQMGATKSQLATYAGKPKQIIIATEDNYRPIIMDGTTAGGKFKSASIDELNTAKDNLQQQIDEIKGVDGDGGLSDKLDKSVYEADKPKFARRDETNTFTETTTFSKAVTFSTPVTGATAPTDGNHLTNKTYVDTQVETKLGKNENAISATKLQTTRNITLTGNASGTASFDGTNDASINVTVTQATNATNATKATQDSEGNIIKDTYAKKSEIPSSPDLSGLIKRTGDRNSLAGYSSGITSGAASAINESSPDDGEVTSGSSITVSNGTSGKSWCKVRRITAGVTSISLESNWKWQGGEAPEIKYPCILVCYWCNGGGIAALTKGAK